MSAFGEGPVASWIRPVHVSVKTNTPFDLPIARDIDLMDFEAPIERAFVEGARERDEGHVEDGQEQNANLKRCNFRFVGVLFGRYIGRGRNRSGH
jgi:hypothetical protein